MINFTKITEMKKLIALIPILFLFSFMHAQQILVYEWRDSVKIGKAVATDTVIMPPNADKLHLGGCYFTVTIDGESLRTNTTRIEIGGGGGQKMALRGTKNVFKYSAAKIDTVQPYTIDKTKIDFIQWSNGVKDTIYIKTFNAGTQTVFGFDVPMLRVFKGSDVNPVSYLNFDFKFYKQ